MKTRRLGTDGPDVSALCLGRMAMSGVYGRADDAESVATIHAADPELAATYAALARETSHGPRGADRHRALPPPGTRHRVDGPAHRRGPRLRLRPGHRRPVDGPLGRRR